MVIQPQKTIQGCDPPNAESYQITFGGNPSTVQPNGPSSSFLPRFMERVSILQFLSQRLGP